MYFPVRKSIQLSQDRLEDERKEYRSLVANRRKVHFPPQHLDGLNDQFQPSNPIGTGVISSGARRPGRESDYLHLPG